LKFLLDFFDPGLELLTGGLLLDSFILGLAQGFLQGLDFGRRSYLYYNILVSTQHLRSLNTQQDNTNLVSAEAAV
jgi:hypothetical protein